MRCVRGALANVDASESKAPNHPAGIGGLSGCSPASGGAQGQATDIEIQAREIIKTREQLNRIYADRTGQSLERIAADMERDMWLSPNEAREYGLIDSVLEKRG